MTPKEIHQLIGKDLTEKIKESNKKPYHYYSKLKICSEPTLTSIMKGNGGNKLNLKVLFELYRAMGYNEINIKDGEKGLLIKPV
jgi:hypothetical protein